MGTGFGNQTRSLSVVCIGGVLGVSMIRFCRDQCFSSSFQGLGFCGSLRVQGVQVALTTIAVSDLDWGFNSALSDGEAVPGSSHEGVCIRFRINKDAAEDRTSQGNSSKPSVFSLL